MKEIKTNPKISVIIPCFLQMECSSTGRFPYFEYFKPIKECIDSVLSQGYENKEVIFADYKSELGSGDIRNKAIEKAKGEIIFFLCPEAVLIDSNQLGNLVKVFQETDADVVAGSSIANRKISPLFIYLLDLEYEERERLMGEREVSAGATSYFAIKKSVLEKAGGFPLKSTCINTGNAYFDSGFADWDFCGMLKEEGYKIWHTQELKVYHLYQTKIYSYLKKQFLQTWYRIAYLRRFRSIKEGYTNNKILIQFVLFSLLSLLAFLSIFLPGLFFQPFMVSLLVVLVWELFLKFNLFLMRKDIRAFLLLPISLVRGFVWFFGAVKGFSDFCVFKTFYPKIK